MGWYWVGYNCCVGSEPTPTPRSRTNLHAHIKLWIMRLMRLWVVLRRTWESRLASPTLAMAEPELCLETCATRTLRRTSTFRFKHPNRWTRRSTPCLAHIACSIVVRAICGPRVAAVASRPRRSRLPSPRQELRRFGRRTHRRRRSLKTKKER